MKIRLLTILFLIQFSGLRADSLWVHHIGVGQGDATLIVAWQSNATGGVDTTSILIDAGNSSGKGTAVFNYMNDVLGTIRRVNFVITSHLHSDHIGGMPMVLQLLHNNNWRVDYVIDRGATMQPNPDSCYSDTGFIMNDTVQPVDLPGSQIYKNYQAVVNSYYSNRRYNIPPGVDLFRAMGRPGNMSMLTVASNACVLLNYGYSNYACAPNPNLDENDYSYAFLLSFEGYKYFTGGDIGGAPPYLDLETPLVTYFETEPIMDFHFCTYKASHHGSPHSTNAGFANYTLPTLTVVPSALRSFNGTQLPGASTLQLLGNVGSLFTYTYQYNTSPSSGTIAAFIDVKFRISNPDYYEDIAIPVYSRTRSKTSPYAPTGVFALQQQVSCDKYHDNVNAPAAAAPIGMAVDKKAATALKPGTVKHPVAKSTSGSKKHKRLKRKVYRLETRNR